MNENTPDTHVTYNTDTRVTYNTDTRVTYYFIFASSSNILIHEQLHSANVLKILVGEYSQLRFVHEDLTYHLRREETIFKVQHTLVADPIFYEERRSS